MDEIKMSDTAICIKETKAELMIPFNALRDIEYELEKLDVPKFSPLGELLQIVKDTLG